MFGSQKIRKFPFPRLYLWTKNKGSARHDPPKGFLETLLQGAMLLF